MEEEVAAEALRSALAAVPGVASADVQLGDTGDPTEVTIRLRPDADQAVVGREVQRVLATRGMRTRLAEPADAPPTLPTDEAVAAVVPMTRVSSSHDTAPVVSWGRSGIRSVAVEERRDSLGVVVRLDDGRMGTRREITTREAIDGAVVAALADALGVRIDAVATEWQRFGEDDVVTVVVRRGDGETAAGAAVGGLGRAYTIALAARAALDPPEG